jgi:hypothetical protein
LHQPALQLCLQLMRAGRTNIATMDIRLLILVSPPRVLLSPSLDPLLVEAPSSPTPMPLPPKAIYHLKEELYALI